MSGIRKRVVQTGDHVDPLRVRELSHRAVLYDEARVIGRAVVGAAATIGDDDVIVTVDTTGVARVVALPAAAAQPGRLYVVKKVDAAAVNLTLTPASGLIDGGATLAFGSGAVDVRRVWSDGVNWWTV